MASSSHSNAVDFSGATYCVVTGASKGIGRAIATEVAQLLGSGSVMLLLARDQVALGETADLCRSSNVRVEYNQIDLCSATDADMQQVLSDSVGDGRMSDFNTFIIFHNVGSLGDLDIEAQSIENTNSIHEYYNLNVFNVISLNTQFMKLIRGMEDRAVIVNVSSLCAIKPMAGMAFYCSGKAAREMYFRVLAEENKNVTVLNYAPGPVETAMIETILDTTINRNLRDVFESFKSQKVLLKTEVTARKCLKVLSEGKFKSGDHVDYFDDE